MAVENILSIVIAASTVIYTVTSLMLWVESRETRKQKITPNLIAYLKSAENHIMLELRIKNIGEGIAKNIQVKVIQDYNRMGKNNLLLSKIGIVENGLNHFPPQYELKYYIGSMTDIYQKDKNGFIELEISYTSSDNRKFSENFKLPFKSLFDQNYSNPPETYIGQIPYYLKEINSTIKKSLEQ